MPRSLLAAAAILVLAAPTTAQVDTTATPVDSVVVTPRADVAIVPDADTARALPMSPRGAFIRSMVLPGWGQSAFDSYFRGGVFFAGWAANWFMNVRNYLRLDNARDRLDIRREQVIEALLAEGVHPDTIPLIIDAELDDDPLGDDLLELVDAREQQREDWIAWSIFWILASGIDGYVTAHLYDFPASIELESNADRSVSLRVDVPFPGRRP